jgi:hypothetical protein
MSHEQAQTRFGIRRWNCEGPDYEGTLLPLHFDDEGDARQYAEDHSTHAAETGRVDRYSVVAITPRLGPVPGRVINL